MGLDVYLVPKEVEESQNEHERAWEALSKRREEGKISVEEYEEERKNLPAWERSPDVKSTQHPEHLFNRRYLRSSYNGSGFDRAVPEFVGDPEKTLSWIFDPVLNGVYTSTLNEDSVPALRDAAKRAQTLAKEIRKATPLRVLTEDAVPMTGTAEHLWSEPPSSDDALAWYREQVAEAKGSGWSSAKGCFWAHPEEEGLEVLAAVPGKDILGRPALHLIYKATDTEWYAQAAEITAEFCDEAVALITQDGVAYIHWSG